MKCSINSAHWVRESRAVQLRRDVLRKVRAQPAAFCGEENPEAEIRWVSLLDAFPKIPPAQLRECWMGLRPTPRGLKMGYVGHAPRASRVLPSTECAFSS